jgi:hypothetical protein
LQVGAERALHQAIAAAVEAWPKGAQPAAQVRERERERERERGAVGCVPKHGWQRQRLEG